MSSMIGDKVRVSVFGESHGPAIGVVVDGLPAGEAIDLEAVQAFMRRRAPGGKAYATRRREADQPEILAHNGKDKIALRIGQVSVFLPAAAQPHAKQPAGAKGNQRLR